MGSLILHSRFGHLWSMSSFEAPTTQSSRASSVQADRSQRQASHSHLHPEDAFYANSPPRRDSRQYDQNGKLTTNGDVRRRGNQRRSRSRRERTGNTVPKGQWRKLLWVKQSYPDNYTDEETFLDHLQRNPRLQPYEFWPLVADSTIIVQHVCSVVIFVCAFAGIYLKRVKPETVVGWATLGTVAGWVVRDYWQSREEAEAAVVAEEPQQEARVSEDMERASMSPASEDANFGMPFKEQHVPLAMTPDALLSQPHSRNPSMASAAASSAAVSPTLANGDMQTAIPPTPTHLPPWTDESSVLPSRMRERLATAKSAILIYCSLLGLSPILKSLTMSTSSDSIWALSSWLMVLNVMTFDYGASHEAKFPAPLSTNAALMASTVLASRLPSTTHVFSLTLFSIEVFGLFPVFRRHLRHHSWTGHLWLTGFLVVLASGGLSMTISGGGYIMGIAGVVLGSLLSCLIMGMTSWWLIGLQRYKNEIHGPWDPARPVIRRH